MRGGEALDKVSPTLRSLVVVVPTPGFGVPHTYLQRISHLSQGTPAIDR